MNAACRKAFCLLLGICPLAIAERSERLSAAEIVGPGRATVWKFLDDGTEPAGDWRQTSYDDSRWKSGQAPLGFGEQNLATNVTPGPDEKRRRVTTWFRHEFDISQTELNARLAALVCVDDGAIVFLNGVEIGRLNIADGPIDSRTFAKRTIGNDEEGFYQRLRLPAGALRSGQKNVLAVEVHQATAQSSDLFFDLALKAVPAPRPESPAPAAAWDIIKLFNQRHYVGPGLSIPDGYFDGGRRMAFDDGGHASSGREILVVDRSCDAELAADLEFARSAELKALAPLDRVQRLAARIDRETTPPGGRRWVERTTAQLEGELSNQQVLIGDWLDQCQAGVCRHRGLLFKLLGDEAGLRVALVRGNYLRDRPPGFPHVWNEVTLDGGRRVLVDVMHNGGAAKYLDVTDAEAVEHYRKVDDTAWYGAASDK